MVANSSAPHKPKGTNLELIQTWEENGSNRTVVDIALEVSRLVWLDLRVEHAITRSWYSGVHVLESFTKSLPCQARVSK